MMRHDGDITDDRTLRLTVSEAASALGISAEAVRQRIKRRTLTTEKDHDGTVYVLLESDRMRTNADRTNDQALILTHLDHLEREVEFLRAELRRREEKHQEENRRKDHLLAAALERIPELEAAEEPRDTVVTASEDEAKGDVPPEAQKSSWWRRIFAS
jgi:hypothetical protein